MQHDQLLHGSDTRTGIAHGLGCQGCSAWLWGPPFPGCTAALTAGPGGCRGRGRDRDGAVEPRGCCGRETRGSHGRAGALRAGPGPAAHLPAGAAAPPCSEPAAGHGRGGGGGDGGRSAALSASGGTGRALPGAVALRSLPALRVSSPGNAPSPRPRRLRHGRPRAGGAPPLPGAHLLPRLRAAAGSPPVPDRQPELRQQGPHGARAAELLQHPLAQVLGSSGQDWHGQEPRPEHVPGEEPLHRPRHVHHRLRAPGLPPQLQRQRPLALQGPAAVAGTPQSHCGFWLPWENHLQPALMLNETH